MAQEQRENKILIKSRKRTSKSIAVYALQICLLCSFTCLAAENSSAPEVPIQMLTQVNSSLPLWGGGQEVMNLAALVLVPEDQINLHHFDDLPCGSCHEPPAASTDQSSNSDYWKTGVNVNHSCTSFGCHEYDEKMNHPINVQLPAGLAEINQSSTVTCLSCHQPQPSDNPESIESQPDALLQNPQQAGCESCHEKMSGSLKQRSHWKFSQKAHLVTLKPGSDLDKSSSDLIFSDIDQESNSCVSCHDKVKVTIPAVNETPRQKAQRFTEMTDHPIGMDYQAILSQNSMYFNSIRDKQNQIRLFDGKVGCGSCHSLYSQDSSNLVVEYKGSVLCRTCHNR